MIVMRAPEIGALLCLVSVAMTQSVRALRSIALAGAPQSRARACAVAGRASRFTPWPNGRAGGGCGRRNGRRL